MSQYQVTITRGGQVTLPARLRRKLGLKLGGKVVFREAGQTVVVEPPRFTLDEVAGSIKAKRPILDIDRAIREAKDEKVERDVEKGLYG